MRLARIIFMLIMPFFMTACAGSAYQLPKVDHAEMMLVENEIKADEKPLKVYKRSSAHYKNRVAKIAKRLQKSAKSLCDISEYNPCNFEVNYSNEDTVNAYAHENNKITVFKGFLQYLKNDEEMAALIGHEMGHHLANHNEEQLQNAQTGAAVSGIVTALLIGAANANNPYYNSYQQQQDQQALEDMMVAGFELGKMSYSKEQEKEADLLAAYLLRHARYDLKKAQNLMYVMSKIDADEVPGKAALLSSHPPSSARVVAWEKTIDEIKSNETKLPYLKNQN